MLSTGAYEQYVHAICNRFNYALQGPRLKRILCLIFVSISTFFIVTTKIAGLV